MSTVLKTSPAVFVVGNEYQIMVPVNVKSRMYVEIGDKKYFDHINGVLRWSGDIHKVSVPQKELDEARKYTVVIDEVELKTPGEEPIHKINHKFDFCFYPAYNKDKLKLAFISDTHGNIDAPIKVGNFCDIDILVMAGDISSYYEEHECLFDLFKICDGITHGEKPIINARGNHDLRGEFAEKVCDYIPTENGKTYYTFSVGNVTGVVLDCGEDKVDEHIEYSGAISCHAFREEETLFLEKIAENNWDNQKLRLIISHDPFMTRHPAPFDIEEEIYNKWTHIISEKIKPHFMLSGHEHALRINRMGGKYDSRRQPCDVLVGADPRKNYDMYVGSILTIKKDEILVQFVGENEEILMEETVKLN